MGATREGKAQNVEGGAEVEPAAATALYHRCGAGELETRDVKPVAATHRQDRSAIEARPEGDQQVDVAEDVKKASPHGRPGWRLRQVNSRESVDVRKADSPIDMDE